jgi:hypothetical protein
MLRSLARCSTAVEELAQPHGLLWWAVVYASGGVSGGSERSSTRRTAVGDLGAPPGADRYSGTPTHVSVAAT